jgi:hypothetical protein
MPNYSIANHLLVLNSTFSDLEVRDRSDNSLVTSFDLDTAHSVACADGNYQVASTTSGTGYLQNFDPTLDHSFVFEDEDGIGISDLRVEKLSQFTYHLDMCPIILQLVDSVLEVECPCAGAPCVAPSTTCCTVVELE